MKLISSRIAIVATMGLFALSFKTPSAIATKDGPSIPSSAAFDHSHAAWSVVLTKYIHRGEVDYAGIKRDGQQALNQYLRSMESVSKSQYQSWTRKQKMAFGINAYNAYTIRLVIDNYPLKSMRKMGLLPGAAWREKFIPLDKIWGKKISLGELENDILRAKFKDPRIHFALVCASKSCPILRSEAFRDDALNKQLEDQARRFMKDKSKNRFDASEKKLYLSKIFDWYKDDFIGPAPSVAAYAAQFMTDEVKTAVAAGNVQVEYLSYDWSLNGK